jgi:hypothetical protein
MDVMVARQPGPAIAMPVVSRASLVGQGGGGDHPKGGDEETGPEHAGDPQGREEDEPGLEPDRVTGA